MKILYNFSKFGLLLLIITTYSVAKAQNKKESISKNGILTIKNETKECEFTSVTVYFDEPTKVTSETPVTSYKIKIIRPQETASIIFTKENAVIVRYEVNYTRNNEPIQYLKFNSSFSIKLGETKVLTPEIPAPVEKLKSNQIRTKSGVVLEFN